MFSFDIITSKEVFNVVTFIVLYSHSVGTKITNMSLWKLLQLWAKKKAK